MRKAVISLAVMAALAASVTACRKSPEEIELEREKIALQREKLKQLKESKQIPEPAVQVKSETKPDPTPIEPQSKAAPVAADNRVDQVVVQPQQEIIRKMAKGIMVAFVRSHAKDQLVRSLDVRYREPDSILCGEIMTKDGWRRFVNVNTYNSKQGDFATPEMYTDHDFSVDFSENIWREYCR